MLFSSLSKFCFTCFSNCFFTSSQLPVNFSIGLKSRNSVPGTLVPSKQIKVVPVSSGAVAQICNFGKALYCKVHELSVCSVNRPQRCPFTSTVILTGSSLSRL